MRRLKADHVRLQHLTRLRSVYPYTAKAPTHSCFYISAADEHYLRDVLMKLPPGRKVITVCPGAADQNKRWRAEGYAQVCDALIEREQSAVVFAGDQGDRDFIETIQRLMKNSSVNLSGEITLQQLGGLLKYSRLAIVNDSAPMHLASYLNTPVLALFGPTDPRRYGPWSFQACVVEKKQHCGICAGKDEGKHACMEAIEPADILNSILWDHGEICFKKPNNYARSI